MNRITWSLLLVIFIGLNAHAQNNPKIVGLALVKSDSVVLRWAPSSLAVWQTGIRYGYVVERFTIARNNIEVPDGLTKGTLLSQSPVKPYAKAFFENYLHTDSNAAVIEEAIYSPVQTEAALSNNYKSFMKSYEELETKMGFALFICDITPELSAAAGLRFTDHTAIAGERYVYRIKTAGTPAGLSIDPLILVVDAGKIEKLPVIEPLKAIFLDKLVKLRWPVMLHKGIYTAYILEKSNDGINYTSVSDLPLVTLSEKTDPDFFVFTDSLRQNGTQVWYRVKGITPFGESGPVSKPVEGSGAPEFKAYAAIDTAWVENNRSVTIKWRVTENSKGLVKGITISRATNPDNGYTAISNLELPTTTRTFTDKAPQLSNYYRVTLLGKDGARIYSFPYLVQTEDNNPPVAPVNLSGKVDSSGIVTITWKHNTEPDIAGYKVFRANAAFEDFINISRTETPNNWFTDTINLHTLTPKIYYRVVALDKRYNASPFSAILELTRPDTIKPVAAQIRKTSVTDKAVELTFESSPSADVVLYKLYRNNQEDTLKTLLKTWEKLPVSYIDKLTDNAIKLKYTLSTIDKTGNTSYNERLVYTGLSKLPQIKLTAARHSSGKYISLQWTCSVKKETEKTLIYRSEGDGTTVLYETLIGNVSNFDDYRIETGTKYNYRILVKYSDGSSSGLSKGVEVE